MWHEEMGSMAGRPVDWRGTRRGIVRYGPDVRRDRRARWIACICRGGDVAGHLLWFSTVRLRHGSSVRGRVGARAWLSVLDQPAFRAHRGCMLPSTPWRAMAASGRSPGRRRWIMGGSAAARRLRQTRHTHSRHPRAMASMGHRYRDRRLRRPTNDDLLPTWPRRDLSRLLCRPTR